MPHCIIEYSSTIGNDITIDQLMQSVHQGAEDSALFDVNDIKTRAIPYSYHMPATAEQRFIHVCAKLLSGRTPEQRQHLSQSIMNRLLPLSLKAVSLTVEIVDIESSSYSKQVTS
ncbi:5-carboxymethyl-2-hydroxymuconate Delta-isomerase [Eionea flava]